MDHQSDILAERVNNSSIREGKSVQYSMIFGSMVLLHKASSVDFNGKNV